MDTYEKVGYTCLGLVAVLYLLAMLGGVSWLGKVKAVPGGSLFSARMKFLVMAITLQIQIKAIFIRRAFRFLCNLG